jgi:hypothetical protein
MWFPTAAVLDSGLKKPIFRIAEKHVASLATLREMVNIQLSSRQMDRDRASMCRTLVHPISSDCLNQDVFGGMRFATSCLRKIGIRIRL